jgi:hypothetical protein
MQQGFHQHASFFGSGCGGPKKKQTTEFLAEKQPLTTAS